MPAFNKLRTREKNTAYIVNADKFTYAKVIITNYTNFW